MKFYFSLKSIPELSDLSPAERRLAWHACKGRAWRRWQTWVATALAAAVGLGLAYGVMWAIYGYRLHLWTHIGPLPSFFLMGFLGGGILVGVTQLLRWPVVAGQIRPCLRTYVEERTREIQQIREEAARSAQ
jgi:hypothetical protein